MAYLILTDTEYTINNLFQGTNELPIYAGRKRSDGNIIGQINNGLLNVWSYNDIADATLGSIDSTNTAQTIYLTRIDGKRPAPSETVTIPLEIYFIDDEDKCTTINITYSQTHIMIAVNAYATSVNVIGTSVSAEIKITQRVNLIEDTTPYLIDPENTTYTGNFSLEITAHYQKLVSDSPPVWSDTRTETKNAIFNASYRMNAYNSTTHLWEGTFSLSGSIPSAFSEADATNKEAIRKHTINIDNSAFTLIPSSIGSGADSTALLLRYITNYE